MLWQDKNICVFPITWAYNIFLLSLESEILDKFWLNNLITSLKVVQFT